jgi:hypothetical protein
VGVAVIGIKNQFSLVSQANELVGLDWYFASVVIYIVQEKIF